MNLYREELLKKIGITNPEHSLTKLDWLRISVSNNLPEEFIREFKDKVCWGEISALQNLSEEIMRECKDKIVWTNISRKQKLSNEFLIEFEDKIDWKTYFCFQNAEFLIFKKYFVKTDFSELDFPLLLTNHLTDYQKRDILKLSKIKRIFSKIT
jgi:hypothetical protein